MTISGDENPPAIWAPRIADDCVSDLATGSFAFGVTVWLASPLGLC
jgi:hypothetical protein